ncbi:MAG: hypothetical protein M3177_02755 [Pseudomonadota bacterium]|nr:hypothetical protein [Pseudomonadota bacterium]
MLKLFMALAAFAGIGQQAPAANQYAEGQVWEYRTRAGEEESLLKIQRIEALGDPPRPVYHISIVGIRFGGPEGQSELPHLPVSRETLDASVTRLASRTVPFPTPDEGIAEWRSAQGGVFTIPVAEIVAVAEQAVREARAQMQEGK